MVGATRYDDLARAIADAYPTLPNRLQGLARYALDTPPGLPRMGNTIFAFAMTRRSSPPLMPDRK